VKITINGETFSSNWDLNHVSMSDALAIEKVANRRYVEWEMEFLGGSAEATAAFIAFTWQRDGREVELQNILDGSIELDFSETYSSIMNAIAQAQAEARSAREGPTSGAGPRTAPDGTDTTSSGTSDRSPKSSASARGKSES
jgi:hypothetical protein